MFRDIPRLLIKWLINSLALFAAAYLVSGIHITDFWSGVAAAALLGIVNAVLRPVIILLTLPINVMTLGLFTLVINAFMLKLVSLIIPEVVVKGFWPAFWGALVISLVSWLITVLFDAEVKFSVWRGGRR